MKGRILIGGSQLKERAIEEAEKIKNLDINNPVELEEMCRMLRPLMREILLLARNGKISNVNRYSKLIDYTFSHVFGAFRVLEEANLLEKMKIGRTNVYLITNRGVALVDRILEIVGK